MVIVFVYLFLGFIFSSLFYIFQDKLKAFLNEDEELSLDEYEELSPEECLFLIGLGWGCVIPGLLLVFVFKKWINFLEKIKKTLDK